MPRINAFSRNVNSISLKIFPTVTGIQKFERKRNKLSGERQSPREFIKMQKDVSLRLILKDKGGNQECLPFC